MFEFLKKKSYTNYENITEKTIEKSDMNDEELNEDFHKLVYGSNKGFKIFSIAILLFVIPIAIKDIISKSLISLIVDLIVIYTNVQILKMK